MIPRLGIFIIAFGMVFISVTVKENAALAANPPVITSTNASSINKRIADLNAQISVLALVIVEQNEQKKTATAEVQPSYQRTIDAVTVYVDELKREQSSIDNAFNSYLTSVKQNDKDLYLSARKASEIYPKIPYYIPGTSETGEFWVEPIVTDKGEMRFGFKFIDTRATIDKTRAQIDMSLSEMSMADTNCTRWRRKTVPVWLIEKGAHAPGLVRLVCCAL